MLHLPLDSQSLSPLTGLSALKLSNQTARTDKELLQLTSVRNQGQPPLHQAASTTYRAQAFVSVQLNKHQFTDKNPTTLTALLANIGFTTQNLFPVQDLTKYT